MYADDLVIFTPYSSEFGIENDVKYNATKSTVIIIRSKSDKHTVFPDFILNGAALSVSIEVKYLGHFVTDDFRDDKDIYRQCRRLYAQGNTLIRKFHMCTADVKANLFRTYCTPLYTAHLWWNYRLYSIRRLNVAYNDIMRLLLRLPRYHSASQMFANINVPAFQAVVRNLIFKFICRLDKSENVIIQGLVKVGKSDLRFISAIWRHWYHKLYVHFDNGLKFQ